MGKIARGVKVTERGWVGHLGGWYQFRRNTLVEGRGRRYVVSTVGALLNPTTGLYEPVEPGRDRYYETMVYSAVFFPSSRRVWDIAFCRPVDFESVDRLKELPTLGADVRANKMHDAVVGEVVSWFRKSRARSKEVPRDKTKD